ncbi:hypothetical protein CDAR_610491 [Caerostris darwini]|uniref:Uncharacterized protein n=1 Tax=Caerostris darwini TaxID=1538125 RepID=A0AAV4WV37_9ARAC|nr:hypothetical protein CDAR_610491 [Caerostris darwini]
MRPFSCGQAADRLDDCYNEIQCKRLQLIAKSDPKAKPVRSCSYHDHQTLGATDHNDFALVWSDISHSVRHKFCVYRCTSSALEMAWCFRRK